MIQCILCVSDVLGEFFSTLPSIIQSPTSYIVYIHQSFNPTTYASIVICFTVFMCFLWSVNIICEICQRYVWIRYFSLIKYCMYLLNSYVCKIFQLFADKLFNDGRIRVCTVMCDGWGSSNKKSFWKCFTQLYALHYKIIVRPTECFIKVYLNYQVTIKVSTSCS